MSKRFLAFMPFIFKWEGGFDQDPSDPGNYVNGKMVGTNFGIDARSHPTVDIKALSKAHALEIYSDEWDACGSERLPYPLGEVYFNACVNMGKGRADKIMAATRSAGSFLDAQQAFYERLAEARPKSAKYLKGWTNRTDDLRKFLKIP